MLATAVCLCLVSLTAASSSPTGAAYNVVLSKSVGNAQVAQSIHYYMDVGQCDGVIDTKTVCGGPLPVAIEVAVSDYQPFPKVSIGDSIDSVRIQRIGGCAGQANIEFHYGCSSQNTAQNHRVQVPDPSSDNNNEGSTAAN